MNGDVNGDANGSGKGDFVTIGVYCCQRGITLSHCYWRMLLL